MSYQQLLILLYYLYGSMPIIGVAHVLSNHYSFSGLVFLLASYSNLSL